MIKKQQSEFICEEAWTGQTWHLASFVIQKKRRFGRKFEFKDYLCCTCTSTCMCKNFPVVFIKHREHSKKLEKQTQRTWIRLIALRGQLIVFMFVKLIVFMFVKTINDFIKRQQTFDSLSSGFGFQNFAARRQSSDFFWTSWTEWFPYFYNKKQNEELKIKYWKRRINSRQINDFIQKVDFFAPKCAKIKS